MRGEPEEVRDDQGELVGWVRERFLGDGRTDGWEIALPDQGGNPEGWTTMTGMNTASQAKVTLAEFAKRRRRR